MGFSLGKVGGILGGVLAPVTLGATALGGGLDFYSAQQQNRMQEAMANKSMDFSQNQASAQMAFQERMSSTAHQREVEDLRKAGLNPILSANSGASSPGGASGTGAVAPVVPELSTISSSAREAISLFTQYKSAAAAAKASEAQAEKAGVDADLMRKKGPEAELDQRFYKFINDLLDRFGKSSAKSSGGKSKLKNWLDPNRNELDDWIESPNTKFDFNFRKAR